MTFINILSQYFQENNKEEDIQNLCREFFNNEQVELILSSCYDACRTGSLYMSNILLDDDTSKYSDEDIINISNMKGDELQAEYNNGLEISGVVEDACNTEKLLLYSNEDYSYKCLAIAMLGAVLYKNINNKVITNYDEFLNNIDKDIKDFKLDDFIVLRDTIIRDYLENIDPMAEYVIYRYINIYLPAPALANCELRKTIKKRVNEVLQNYVGEQYLKNCKEYIYKHPDQIDNYLNNYFNNHIDKLKANIERKTFDLRSSNQDTDNLESDKVIQKKVIIDDSDPSTWDINTFLKHINIEKINEIINNNISDNSSYLSYFPPYEIAPQANKAFINQIQTQICNNILWDMKQDKYDIETKEQLINHIKQVYQNLTDDFIIETRNEILRKHNHNRDYKISKIISHLNNELNKKFAKKDYLKLGTKLHLVILEYLKNVCNINQRINKAFIQQFRSLNVNAFIYSSSKNDNNIHYIYIANFPDILSEDLYEKDIRDLQDYMFSTNKVDTVISNCLKSTQKNFLPESEEYYQEFTQLLIIYLLNRYKSDNYGSYNTIAGDIKKGGGRLINVFNILYDRYKDFITKSNINTIANTVREQFFEKNSNIMDPLIMDIIMQLFPRLGNSENISQFNNRLCKSLLKYIYDNKKNNFQWANLSTYIKSITRSVFHNKYDPNDIDNVCYNSVFLSVINSLQKTGNEYFNTVPFNDAIKSGKHWDTSKPRPEPKPQLEPV